METKTKTKELTVGLGIYPNAVGTYVATINDPNPIADDIVAEVFGFTHSQASEKAEKFVKAINMHDELIDSLRAIKMFVNSASKEYPVSGHATLLVINNLLKQAEKNKP